MGDDGLEAAYDEQPKHLHPMPTGYWIGRNDITWKQYRAYCAATGAKLPSQPGWPEGDDHPVVNVSWNEAKSFCRWAGVSLPTEAEWEKAARGTDARIYPWGMIWDGSKCNHGTDERSPFTDVSDGWEHSSPVGAFPEGASVYGALDMAGNVWQWCDDAYDQFAYDRYAKISKPPQPASSAGVILRGGSWDSSPRLCRSTHRRCYDPSDSDDNIGFRVVLKTSTPEDLPGGLATIQTTTTPGK